MLKLQWLQNVQLQLALFVAQDDFYSVMVTAFGDRLDQQKLQSFRQQWLEGNFTIIPEVHVLSQGELGSNNGAYSAKLDRIFVSSDFLTVNQGDTGAIANLLLEELGHKLDQFLNGGIDSAGDEGAIFVALSQGKTLSNEEFINLKAEDDHRIITVDGQQIAVELQSWNGTPGNDNYVGTIDSDQAYGGDGNDTLNGAGGNDYLYGEGGNDSLIGGDGNDVLSGGDGVDTFNGGNGDDQLDSSFRPSNGEIYIGGAGNDYATLSSGVSGITITYTDFNNGTITGGGIIREVEIIAFYGGNGRNIITVTAATTASLYGGEENDNITTGAGNDQIYARGGDDTLRGGAGIDGLQGEGGNDQIYGDTGNDNMSGGEGNDTVSGGLDNDQIYGDGGNDLLNGDEGNDVLIGGNGIDTLNGGSGNDQLGSNFQASNGETFIGGDGTDTATLGSDATGITITYTNINGGTITGGGIIKEIENINFNGGTGNDIFNASAATYAAFSGGDGNDNLTTGLGNDQINGDAGNDSLSAGSGNDYLQSGMGNDSLNGGIGNDYLEGGAGNDSYLIDADIDLGQDTIFEYEPLNSIDIFDFRATSTAIAVNLSLTTMQTIAAGVQVSMSYAMIESALGGSGNDLLMGNSLSNNLQGNGGNDNLDGGTGIDTLIGGLGDDTYTIDTTTDTLTEVLNQGTDTVQSSVTYTLGTNLENLLLTSSAAINGTGNTLNNIITGNGANNILNGGTGIDTLIGSFGDDIYLVDSTTDILTEALNQGIDTVQSSVTYTLGTNLENLTLTGSTAINGTGNTLNNVIMGNAANNILAGGAGINTLIGGLGNDFYLVDTTTDILTEALNQGTDTVQSSVTFTLSNHLENLILTGNTAINGTGNTLNNTLTGNIANNLLNGVLGNDILNGGDGNDSYLIDADVDLGVDTINETATGGKDYLDFRTTSIGVTVNLGLTTLQTVATGVQLVIPVVAIESVYGGSGNDALTGGQGSNELYGYDGNDSLAGDGGNDFLFGWNGDDFLIGGSGDDLFYGDTGNDTLYGGTGNDTLNGGYGNDTYIIDADVDLGIDTINDNSAFGTDIIDFRSTTSKAITLNLGLTTIQTVATGVQLIMPVANLTSVYGGTGNDNLIGNNLVNYLMGGIGNDTLAGGEGNDTYIIDADVDTGIDSIIETGGIDTLDFRSTTTKGVTVNLAINATPLVQTIAPGVQLSMSTTPIEYVYGGTGNDNLTGNNSNNYLIGGVGNDSLTGGVGNDTYVIDADVDTGLDSIIETATGGIDTLNFSSTTTEAITLNLGTTIVQTIATGVQLTMPTGAIENAYGGAINDNIIGNNLNNRLYGLSDSDQLNGGLGNDLLDGGLGNDTFTGGEGNDSLYGYGGDDLMNGGNGADSFYFKGSGISTLTGGNTVATLLGRDSISDFTVNVDKIALSKSTFTAITSAVGTSIGTNFIKVANELSVDTQFASIVYCQGNGNLYYNQNGNTVGLGTNGGNFAVLTGLPTLTGSNFVIVA